MQYITRCAGTSVLLFALVASAAGAQTASLVTDISTRGEDIFDSSPFPQGLLRFGERIVFRGRHPQANDEPWVTDGTATGTEMLADIYPAGGASNFQFLGPVGGALLIAAQQPSALWRTDGTRAGTVPVTEAGAPRLDGAFAVTAEALFFSGCTPDLGCEPWISDGTSAGTRLLRDIVPGDAGSEPREAIVLDDEVFFVTGPIERPELWASDGSAAGTRLVAALPGTWARLLTAAGDRLFFLLDRDLTAELWVSDGSGPGTKRLARLAASPSFPRTNWLKAIDGRLYFVSPTPSGAWEVWRSDGTFNGTRPVASFLATHPYASLIEDPSQLQVVNGRILFVAATFENSERVPQALWATDGDPASAEVLTFACLAGCTGTTDLLVAGGWVYFAADDGVHGREPWRSDGTAAGTARVADVCPGPCDGVAAASPGPAFIAQDGAVLFVGMDGSGRRDLWRTNGTAAGTRRFSDLPPGVVARPFQLEVARLGDELFFVAGRQQSGQGGLWASDGTPGGTRVVRERSGTPPAYPSLLTAAGSRLLFRATDGTDLSVWQSAGTAATTAAVSPPAPPPPEDYGHGYPTAPDQMAGAGGLGFFYHLDGASVPQLWRTDGTPAGSFPVTALTTTSYGGFLVALGDEVFFPVAVEYGATRRDELWRSDGTVAGTHEAFELPEPDWPAYAMRIAAIGGALYFVQGHSGGQEIWKSVGGGQPLRLLPGPVSVGPDGPQFTAAGASVYFTLSGTASGFELWRTQGSGAVPVAGFAYRPEALREVAGKLVFFLFGSVGWELWRSDGTAAGTVRIAELPGVSLRFTDVAAAGDRLFFLAQDPAGFGIWVSDGTPNGTRRVKVFPAGFYDVRPQWLTGAGGRLFFVAHDAAHGLELWTSDGTAAGTRLLQDLAPGAAPSSPAELTLAGGRLFFVADDGIFGRELWAIDLAQPDGACAGSDNALCLGGRFHVEAAWRDFSGNTGRGRTLPLTADTGAFWFFGPDNVEVVLKVLDGRALNDHHWVFYGALSSVQYALTVTDTQTGLTARYWNPSGQLASVADTSGFGPRGAFSVVEHTSTSGTPPRGRAETAAATGPCQPAATRLCLRGGRFAVEAVWKDFAGNTGVGSAVPLTGDTGYFWFFGADNVEVVLKVLDGTAVNGKHWVFYGALSSVEYTLRVTDTATGAVKTYTNRSGNLASVADTGAF